LFTSRFIQIAVGDLSGSLDADRGPSFMPGSCEDAECLALISEAEDVVDNVPRNEHLD